MSNINDSLLIYVRDLDAHISIDAINEANEREAEDARLELEYEQLGSINLLAGDSLWPIISDHYRLSIAEWNFECYRARRYLRGLVSWEYLEPLLVRKLMSMGRPYAIRRYARAEKIKFASAMTGVLPYGMQALMSQFLTQQGLAVSIAQSQRLSTTWKAVAEKSLTAYGKTGLIRNEIFAIAEEAWGEGGAARLTREETRNILSLTRLHFSVAEMNNGGFARFSQLEALYGAEWRYYKMEEELLGSWGVRQWRKRHLRPLLYYYPFAIRNAVDRGREQLKMVPDARINERATHELALAHCELKRIQTWRKA